MTVPIKSLYPRGDAYARRAQINSHPIHPFLVAFPIGLFITSFIFDVVGVLGEKPPLRTAAWYCIIAGLPPNSSGRSCGYKHALLNLVVIALFIAVAVRRDPAAMPDGMSLVLLAGGNPGVSQPDCRGPSLRQRRQVPRSDAAALGPAGVQGR